ncbi:hypothetical protein B296_00014331 [Ensete ventricosum]|uniref:Uncharacterized protein n=1 Tax=Ensete ventricosum TaxID=4639 RepID=A0A427AFE1_ENSVE|nr:hypothetical protein B296_00014331 [Ensete ventricosum]
MKDLNIVDLKVYTMASEEAIDAKFEAFESRMEEKMRSLFVKFSIAGDPRRSKGTTTIHTYGGDFLRAYPGRTIEPRGMKDKGRSSTSHAGAYCPLYSHPSPAPKKLTRDELRNDRPRGCVGIARNHGAANIATKRAGSS